MTHEIVCSKCAKFQTIEDAFMKDDILDKRMFCSTKCWRESTTVQQKTATIFCTVETAIEVEL